MAAHPVEVALRYHCAQAEKSGSQSHGGFDFESAEVLYRASAQGLRLSEIPELPQSIPEIALSSTLKATPSVSLLKSTTTSASSSSVLSEPTRSMTKSMPQPSEVMKPKILKTEAEYSTALAKVELLMDANPSSKQEEELELWSLLVERYEQEHHPIDFPDPIEAIRFRMEQEGLRQKDLAKYFPGKNRVSEVLNHKRPLSLGMIRSLHNGLGIPAHVLLQECTA
jgi:HTH-type transcriptional regulator/antitoxin HigA